MKINLSLVFLRSLFLEVNLVCFLFVLLAEIGDFVRLFYQIKLKKFRFDDLDKNKEEENN